MKIRSGFVSNSSSCSFAIDTISRTGITKEQIEKLMDYRSNVPRYETWSITAKSGIIRGTSGTGNGGVGMKQYIKMLQIDGGLVVWRYN